VIKFIDDQKEKKRVSRDILQSLPEWFGIPESTEEYIKTSEDLPFWGTFSNGKPVGFLAMKETGPVTGEIYVMAVRREYQRSGLGRALWQECLKYAREHGYQYMQVKTIKRGCLCSIHRKRVLRDRGRVKCSKRENDTVIHG